MILITGASGFIGARLVQRLTRDRGERVRALVRSLGTVGGARLATFSGVKIIHADVRSAAAVDEAMRGCDAVVHCAVDVRSAIPLREQVTAEGTRNVLSAARKHGVRHIVFLSTAAVHSWRPAGRWDENAPARGVDSYSRSKLEAERLLLDNSEVPVTIIRPTCVYGPFSRTWTITPVAFLRLGIPLVPDGGSSRANLIYVDNLVDLIVAALDHHPPASRIYLANEEQPADWETLYSAYARAIDVPLRRFRADDSGWRLLREELSVSWSNGKVLFSRLASDLKAPLIRGLATSHRHVPLLQRCDRFVPMGLLRRAVVAATTPAPDGAAAPAGASDGILPFASRELRTFYTAEATFSGDRARRELGWAPRISAAEAIDRTCAWIKLANL